MTTTSICILSVNGSLEDKPQRPSAYQLRLYEIEVTCGKNALRSKHSHLLMAEGSAENLPETDKKKALTA
ncbi:hypothetical protein AVME950_17105 [Acidovorax sp. SUPP950]|uniref:hypothetical protein n=1 Tax=unclassified Acidovorax TaxID=2684926 RepID=UPI0023D78EF2|nr:MULTISPECIES: hypothetical protein [Comamonadaceae]WOI47186.1 hypothetical protein R1Z03_08295 [Paracidovorax avenae]GKS76639.1 hypothetical protein AVME950_17105 [Acidovorax sp. SUPP950]